MRQGWLSALAVGFVVSGCGLAQQAQLQQQYERSSAALQGELADCRRRYPDLVKGQAADALRCSNAAYEKNARSVPGNNADLVTLAGAKSVAAAERFDKGLISRTELDVDLASIQAEFTGGSQVRTQQEIAVSAAQQQAAVARQQAAMQAIAAGAALMTPPPPLAPPALPRQTNCTTYGPRTNCTTW